MDVTEKEVSDLIEKMEEKYEKLKEEEEGEEGEGEKWKPKKDDKIQDHREKVYTEYIDTEKIEAIKKGQFNRFNTVERDFLRKYKDVALKPNYDDREGEIYDIYKADMDYVSQLNELRSFVKKKSKSIAIDDKIKKRNKIENKPDEYTRAVYAKTYSRPRDDMRKFLSKNKTSLMEENEKFLYRYQYAKKNPNAKKSLETEESTTVKTYRNNSVDEFAFENDLRDNINSFKYTDREIGKEFRQSLNRGAAVRGLLERQKQLKDSHHMKDLSEIAYGDDPAQQNLYRTYMSYKKPEKKMSREEDIEKREQKFIEEVEKNYKATSAKANRSFQEYEDYKRIRETEEDVYDNVNNSVSGNEQEMSTRDWYAKIWSGKITNEEFGDYMFEMRTKKDVQGLRQNIFTQKDNPGFGDRDFITQEDKSRLSAEILEVRRRQAVLNGIVSEEESQKYVEDQVNEIIRLSKDYRNPAFEEVKDEFFKIIKAITGGEQVREYYFDSKQGVSLEEHIASVKKVSPDAHIETYVDNEGFTVVKKRIEKKYKYNLNSLLNYPVSGVEEKYHKGVKQMIDDNAIEIKGNWFTLILFR